MWGEYLMQGLGPRSRHCSPRFGLGAIPFAFDIIDCMAEHQNILRRGIHQFVYGLCGIVIGITPPTEKQEVPFFILLLSFFLFVTVGLFLFAVYVIPAFK